MTVALACRLALGAILGFLPGIVLMFFGVPRIGVCVSAIGGLIGLALAMPGVSPSRVARLFGAVIVQYNLPVSNRVYDWVDEGSDTATESATWQDAFTQWILATNVPRRRAHWVIAGLVVGAIVGAALAVQEVVAIQSGRPSWILPLKGAKDSLVSQGVLLTLGITIWSGVVTAIVAAPAFRRMVLFGIGFTAYLSGAIGYTVATPTSPSPFALMFSFTTFAAAFALLMAGIFAGDCQ